MRIKRLEVQGFKSFKDKTVIHFDHSITGIVGPNGCGKSNIVDAFFWVMGEQSYKHIRGTSSEDLIFNGSSHYSPMGMAEATLVMETGVVDTENAPVGATAEDSPVHFKTKEISVTRRVYRSGEGEYFINGVPARLKDIHELFMDTGVGAKGYSVIEQGAISKVVNAKPDERRLLIEEAAGIAKYKARKKESLRKMEATQGNLSRLNDVIAEIERNLGSLERQAQKARQVKKYRDELLDKEMTWGRRKNQVLHQQLEAMQKNRDALEQELVGFRAELQTAENTIEVDRVHQLTETKSSEEFQAKIQELSSEMTHEKSALDLSRRRQGDLASQLSAMESERLELSAAIEASRVAVQNQEEESENAEEILRNASENVRTKDSEAHEARRTSDDSRRALDELKRELMNGVAKASDLSSRAASLASRIESANTQADRLRTQLESQLERSEASRSETESTRDASEKAKARREELLASKIQKNEESRKLDQEAQGAARLRNDKNREVTQIRSRLQSLKELDSAYEGFGNGPKAVLEWARGLGADARLRAVADAIEVSAGYEQALEGWLEGRLENLISEDPDLAIQALARIQSENQGRASIHVAPELPRGTTDFGGINAALEAAGFEVLGDLSRFVRIRTDMGENVSRIAQQLISHVCVVKTLGPVTDFIRKEKLGSLQGWSIAALDGSVLDANGILRGGSTESGKVASVLGRKRAIAELEQEAAIADSVLSEAEHVSQVAQDTFESARAEFEQIQTELQTVEVESASLERDLHQMSRSLREAESQLDHTRGEITRATQDAEDAQTQRTGMEEELTGLTSRREELENRILSLESESQAQGDALRSIEGNLQEARVNEAAIKARAQSLGRELEGNRSLISDRERRLAEVTRLLDRAVNEKEQFTGGESDLITRIEELNLAISEHQATLSGTRDRLEQVNARLTVNLNRVRELHSVGNDKTTEANQLAIDVERLSGEIAHLVQNLEEKYGQGCLDRAVTSPVQEEMTEPVITAEMSEEDERTLGEEVERLRDRIRRLGEVNPMAIEEFEETSKRYEHIVAERRDLEHSIQNLEDAIEHINKTSEERFAKAFEAIKDRFERLFPVIFGGGFAKLELVFPENSTDVLEAGVDITACPPGKKVSSITLLSGGEKALTAVSLIFAIFMVKPSPFCILDEVDAPLDDANIGKFNALLREMSLKSQFILITHNKKTMELNDTLYGVTMEEPGVSKMVSIELQ